MNRAQKRKAKKLNKVKKFSLNNGYTLVEIQDENKAAQLRLMSFK